MKVLQKVLKGLSILVVVGLVILPADFAFATNVKRELTDREKAAFIVRDEWTAWVRSFTASLSELDKNATSRIYDNMDYYDMQYRFTEKYKKVPEYLDEDGKPTQKLKDLIKKKRKEIKGAKYRNYLCFTAKENGTKIKYIINGSLPSLNMGYSTDESSFAPWAADTDITLNSGESIYVLNKSSTLSTGVDNYVKFNITGNVELSGDISSLFNFESQPTSQCALIFLFENCTAITEAEDLIIPFDILSQRACMYMFSECSNLQSAPKIYATTAMANACSFMFNECSSLKTAPEININSVMGTGALSSMFKGCSQLTKAPSILPAKELRTSCYLSMFEDCISLEKAPYIAATNLGEKCFKYMFKGCTSLNEISIAYQSLPSSASVPTEAFYDWVDGVANEGIIYYSGPFTGADDEFGPSKLPKNATYKWSVISSDTTFLTFRGLSSGTNIKYIVNGTVDTDRIYYSKNNGAWTLWNEDTDISLNSNETLRVWNRKNTLSTSDTDYVQFVTSKDVETYGSINSMINFTSATSYCFNRLFKSTHITAAPELPSTIVADSCYREMFSGCDKLTDTPELPALTLANNCYSSMFEGCERLTNASVLPATNLTDGCYDSMFKGCIYLENAPRMLATTIGSGSLANMFNGCQRLNYIDIAYTGNFNSTDFNNWVLSVAASGTMLYDGLDTTVGPSAIPFGWRVQSMLGFKSLANGSKIKYTLNGGLVKDNIFYKKNSGAWTEWTANTDILLDSGDVVKVWNRDNTLSESTTKYFSFVMEGSIQALNDVASLLNNGTLQPYCFYKLFDGCASLTSAPTLSATTLTTGCYQYMFANCTGLERAPDLIANALSYACYNNMFSGCSNLNYINLDYSGQITSTNFGNWVDGVANIGEIVYLGDTNTFGPSALPKDDDNKWRASKPLKLTAKANSTVSYSATGSINVSQIYYKKGNGAWTKWNAGVNVSLNTNESVYIWNKNNTLGYHDTTTDTDYNLKFSMTGSIEASGNVNSMINFAALTPYCFNNLFADCSVLTKSPELPSTTLADGCYKAMFSGCSSLNEITIGYEGPFAGTTYFTDWVLNVSNSGTFYYEGDESSFVYESSAIPKDDTSPWRVVGNPLTITALEDNSRISWVNDMYGGSNNYIYYIKSDGTKVRWNRGDTVTLNAGEKILAIGERAYIAYSQSDRNHFRMQQGKFSVSGRLISLVNYSEGNANRQYAFYRLFHNCVNLATVSDLVLPEIAGNNSYENMFLGCTGITKPPKSLPAKTLGSACYKGMFSGCTNLAETPELPASTLGSNCYESMFEGCSSLVEAPELPVTTLTDSCYKNMFKNCINLTTAQDQLPASTLVQSCYASMFQGCINLTTAPLLQGTTLANNCYNAMFYGCSNLNFIKMQYIGDLPTSNNEFTNWVNGVSNTGTIYYDGPSTTYSASALPKDNSHKWSVERLDYLKITARNSGSTEIAFVPNGGLTLDDREIYYRKNSDPWTRYNSGSISLAQGDAVIFKNTTNTWSESDTKYYTFRASQPVDVSGNVKSLVNDGNLSDYCFYKLFTTNASNIYSAPTLVATTLTPNCYRSMFEGCTNLTTAPNLPATTLADSCYQQMFSGCTGLTTIPDLPATTLADSCYQQMFSGCTNLETVPYIYATTLANSCFQEMFNGCLRLNLIRIAYTGSFATSNNEFTNWVNGVSNTGRFFYDGSDANYSYSANAIPKNNTYKWSVVRSLTFIANDDNVSISLDMGTLTSTDTKLQYAKNYGTWTDLPYGGAVNLNAGETLTLRNLNTRLSYMSGSTIKRVRFIINGGRVSAVGNVDSMIGYGEIYSYCYYQLFEGCSNLVGAPTLPSTTLADHCYQSMFQSCTSLTTAPALPATTIGESCYQSMFQGCTNLTNAPALPATTLATSCYEKMFMNCSSLVNAPNLPSITLASYCYKQMFASCSSLKYIKIYYQGKFNSGNYFENWVYQVPKSGGTFYFNGPNTNYSYGESAIPGEDIGYGSEKWNVSMFST